MNLFRQQNENNYTIDLIGGQVRLSPTVGWVNRSKEYLSLSKD
jgi:hypothetical protein